MATPIIFISGEHKVLDLEIQLVLSILWVCHLKIGPNSKKLSESIKNHTKAGKTLK